MAHEEDLRRADRRFGEEKRLRKEWNDARRVYERRLHDAQSQSALLEAASRGGDRDMDAEVRQFFEEYKALEKTTDDLAALVKRLAHLQHALGWEHGERLWNEKSKVRNFTAHVSNDSCHDGLALRGRGLKRHGIREV